MLSENKKIVFETLEHFWDIAPYLLSFRRTHDKKEPTNANFINKDVVFLFCFKGKISITLNDKEYLTQEGDLLCINSYVLHYQHILEASEYIRLFVSSHFLKQMGVDTTLVRFDELIHHDSKIRECFLKISVEYQNKDSWLDVNMTSHVLELVGYILRNYSQKCESETKQRYESVLLPNYQNIIDSIEYINKNFKEKNITLEELSKASKLSKFYFLKLFDKVIGATPTYYINQVRCDYAKQLLLRGASVTDAAFSSGFNSLSNFEKQFKLHKGVPPSNFAKKRDK